MAKKKVITISQRLKNEIARWTELKNSYPKDGYQTIEDHLKDDEKFLDEFFKFTAIILIAKKRNYINKNKAFDIIKSISYYPYGTLYDSISEDGIMSSSGEIYFKK